MGEKTLEKNSIKIVVVDDEDRVRKFVEQFLKTKGFDVYAAASGEIGVDLVREVKPDLVLTDVKMPKMSGIEVLKAVKKINPETIVIIMTGFSTEDLVLDAFHNGATNYLKKPFDLKSLTEIMDSVEEIINSRKQSRLQSSSLVDYKMYGKVNISLDPAQAGSAVGGVINEVRPYIDAEDAEALHMCLYELVMNSIEHGVYKIGYDLKTEAQEDDRLQELYNERMNNPEFAGHVYVSFQVDPDRTVFTVEDTGDGFDVESLPDPTLDEGLYMSHGRGVTLTRMIADELIYNETGNVARVTKFRSERNGDDE